MWSKIATNLDAWAILGLIAQAAFTGRFLVQWIASERAGRSVIPISFWYLSLLGSAGLLLYAVGRADPVFILGQSFGSIVYVRNLALIRREKHLTRSLCEEPHQETSAPAGLQHGPASAAGHSLSEDHARLHLARKVIPRR